MTVGSGGAKRLSPGRCARRCALQRRERGRTDARSVGNRNVPQWGKGGGGPGNLLMAGCAADSLSPGSGPRTRRTPEGIDFPAPAPESVLGAMRGGCSPQREGKKGFGRPGPPQTADREGGQERRFPPLSRRIGKFKGYRPLWADGFREISETDAPAFNGNDRNVFRRLSS